MKTDCSKSSDDKSDIQTMNNDSTSDYSSDDQSKELTESSLSENDLDDQDIFIMEIKKKPKKIDLSDIDKDIIREIRRDEKKKVIDNLINKGLIKTCTSCGKFYEKFAYRTRKCNDCFKDYTSHYYTTKKKNKIAQNKIVKDLGDVGDAYHEAITEN